jgi:hypothetical protein
MNKRESITPRPIRTTRPLDHARQVYRVNQYPATNHSTIQDRFTPRFGGKAGKRVNQYLQPNQMVLVDGHAGRKWERPTHRMAQRQGFLKRVVVTVAFNQRLKQAEGLSIKKEEVQGRGKERKKKSKHMQ